MFKKVFVTIIITFNIAIVVGIAYGIVIVVKNINNMSNINFNFNIKNIINDNVNININKSYMYGKIDGMPIKWDVLYSDKEKILLITDEVIFAMPFDEDMHYTHWGKSTIRKFLNNEFYESAFSENDKKRILISYLENKPGIFGVAKPIIDEKINYTNTEDKIFLLSESEYNKYLVNNKNVFAKPSKNTLENNIEISLNGNSSYWLRTQGEDVWKIEFINYDGNLLETNGCPLDYKKINSIGVRPAMWIKK